MLVIGRAGMDFYADPPGTAIEQALSFTAALGGSSANIAAALARQGLRPALLTCVSDDAVGRFALAQLDRFGIDRTLVRTVRGDARTSLAVVDTNGDATQAVIYRNLAADLEMTADDADRPDYAAFDAVVTTGTVLVADPSRTATFRAFENARAAGVPVVLDIDHRAYSWPSDAAAAEVYGRAADLAQIVVGNDTEFAVLAGDGDGLDAARALAARGKLVVYKMGGDGAILLQGDAETRFGIYRTAAMKPTGAGDAFMGGFLAALANGLPPADAVRRGSAAAAMVVARVGCAPAMPTSAELDAFLSDHPGPTDAHPAP